MEDPFRGMFNITLPSGNKKRPCPNKCKNSHGILIQADWNKGDQCPKCGVEVE